VKVRYRKRSRLHGLGADRPLSETFGGKLWEWWHPEARRAEYDLSSGTGRTVTPPGGDVTLGDVLDTAATNTLDAAKAAGDYGRVALGYLKIALIGGAVLYGFHLLTEWQRKRKG
jgi:hypothetical protein